MKQKAFFLLAAPFLMMANAPVAQATVYNVEATFYEPQTQPKNTIFTGSFAYDSATKTVSGLTGSLSESMTGPPMKWIPLNYQLSSVSDTNGQLVTVFALNTTNTFTKTVAFGGTDGWAPGSGSGLYYGFPSALNPSKGGIGNSYAMIYVPNNPLSPLTQGQIDHMAYADCGAGGMMGPTCMTGTTVAGYGTLGTMDGYPKSQTITAAVPEPEEYAMMLLGFAMVGYQIKRKQKKSAQVIG
jgi:hypothetical protein